VFTLYDESQTSLLFINEKVPGNILYAESLLPGTTYFYSIASARQGDTEPGIFSPSVRIRTEGTSPANTRLLYAAEVVDSPNGTTTLTTPATTTTPTTIPTTRPQTE